MEVVDNERLPNVGVCLLSVRANGLTMYELNGKVELVSWPIRCIKRFGHTELLQFTIETGRSDLMQNLSVHCRLVYIATVLLAHSKNELIQWRGVRRLSVRLSVCKLLRKSLLLAGKWPDRHQTFTRWTAGQRASRMCSRSRSRSKDTWYAHFLGFLEWATPSLTVWFWESVEPLNLIHHQQQQTNKILLGELRSWKQRY